jgi:hypothetical protein
VREKINSDPRFQIGIVVVLILAAGYMLLGGGLGGGESEEEAAPTEATVAVAGTSATGTATAATPGEAVEGAIEGAVDAASSEVSASAVAASIPPPPLPHPVEAAYDSGKTVVLLVVHNGGIDDRLVSRAVDQLKARPGLAVFVVPAKQISRYAAITLGVEVQQVPALIVMRPRRLSGGNPQASVSYGFQTPQSVVQAVEDASYKGPEATYHPN